MWRIFFGIVVAVVSVSLVLGGGVAGDTEPQGSLIPQAAPTPQIPKSLTIIPAANQPFLRFETTLGLSIAGNWPQTVEVRVLDQNGKVIEAPHGLSLTASSTSLIVAPAPSPSDYVIRTPYYVSTPLSLTAGIGTLRHSVAVRSDEVLWYGCCDVVSSAFSSYVNAVVPSWGSKTVMTITGFHGVWALNFDAVGDLLIGSEGVGLSSRGGGIYRVTRGGAIAQPVSDGVTNVWGLTSDRIQRIWASGPAFLDLLTPALNVAHKFHAGNVGKIAVDPQYNVWISSGQEVSELLASTGYTVHWTLNYRFAGVTAPRVDRYGRLWIVDWGNLATRRTGILYYVNARSQVSKVLQGIDAPEDVVFDHAGDAWIAHTPLCSAMQSRPLRVTDLST
jgi:hypothetical protein